MNDQTTNPTQVETRYAQWLEVWAQAAGAGQPNGNSSRQAAQDLTDEVAGRIQSWETGMADHLDLPSGGTTQELTIAAELGPLVDRLTRLGLTDRELASSEQSLIRARTWGDRPSIAQLRDLGRELADLAEEGISPWDDLGFTPTGYLPTELEVIAQAANLQPHDLYQL